MEAKLFVSGGEIEFSHIVCDSRQVELASLFFALKGERVDGHEFLFEVIDAGAGGVVVSSSFYQSDDRFFDLEEYCEEVSVSLFVVDDTVKALQRLARRYREKLSDLKVVAITGSYGKSTTKDMLKLVLETQFTTFSTPGNLNSSIGLPLSLLQIPPKTEIAVLELGIDFIGEMEQLAEIAQPDVAIIVSLGASHAQFLGGVAGVAREKLKILDFVRPNGEIFLPQTQIEVQEGESEKRILSTEEWLNEYFYPTSDRVNCRVKIFDEGSLKNLRERGCEGFEFSYKNGTTEIDFFLPLIGRQYALNTLITILCGESFGIPLKTIAERLREVKPITGRMEYLPGAPTLLDDSYNASFQSVLAGIEFVERVDWEGRKIVVLGDMRELGEVSVQRHEEVAQRLKESSLDALYLVGEAMKSVEESLVKTVSYPVVHQTNIEPLEEELFKEIQPTDFLYLKGSLATGIHQLASTLREKRPFV